MGQLWHVVLYQPLVNGLVFLYQFLGQNLGWAIIVLTLLIRFLLVPLTLPAAKATQKIRQLAPEIDKLKKKHKDNKQALAQAQMELYRRSGANPAAGCLPQIIQLVVLIALFQAFRQVLVDGGEVVARLNEILYPSLQLSPEAVINTRFLYLDLIKPDLLRLPSLPPLPGFFLVGAALSQFLASKLMMPAAQKAVKVAKKTPGEVDDTMAAAQKQMLYLFPIMTILVGFTFPSGLVLYWVIFSVFTALQQYYLNLQFKKQG